jgi:hypothetical protein
MEEIIPQQIAHRARHGTLNPGSVRENMSFEIVCPNNHDQTVTFNKKGFEDALKSGALVFHCNTCDTNWPPSHEDIAKIRKALAKDPD